MVIGTGIIEIYIPQSHSLKEKRGVLRSLLKRTQNQFNISIAEVGDLDHWQKGKIGFCVVGNDASYINSKIDKVLTFMENLFLAEIVRSKIEIMHFSDDDMLPHLHAMSGTHEFEKI